MEKNRQACVFSLTTSLCVCVYCHTETVQVTLNSTSYVSFFIKLGITEPGLSLTVKLSIRSMHQRGILTGLQVSVFILLCPCFSLLMSGNWRL